MSSLDSLIQDLVIANRILAREEVVDAYGHVSVRHPDDPKRFLIARSLAPDLVGPEDVVELDLDGQPLRDDGRALYLERFIHAAIYLPRNARALMRATQLGGEIKYLSPGEIDARNRGYRPYSVETWRTWEYWANKAGCGHLLTRPEGGQARTPKG